MTDQPVPAARPRRPLGVLIIAATQLLRAGLILGQFLELQATEGLEWLSASAQFVEPTPGTVSHTLIRIIGIGLAAASIAVVGGLLANRRWGWVGAIVLSGLSLAFAIGAWWEGRPVYLNMAINVIAVFYLNQREVRAAYEDHAASDAPIRP
jgi:hypothetical protein